MSLAYRIIPTILARGRALVKGAQFKSWRTVGHVAQAVRVHAGRGVDEVVLLDVGATPTGRGPDLELVSDLSAVLFAPLAVGGGITSVADVKALLRAGADKVVVGSAGVRDPQLLIAIAEAVGRQALVVSVDFFRDGICSDSGAVRWDFEPVQWCRAMQRAGAGEILLQSVERDGTCLGYDLPMIKRVSEAVGIPVIASGGCGTYEHMLQAIQAGASAVAAGAMFQFTDATPLGAAQYLNEKGIEVRIPTGGIPC